MQVTVHRGTHEIGGNCVELVAGSTRIVVDVGMPLVGPDREPFDSKAIKCKGSVQLLADGILPKLPGLFVDGPAPDAIVLPHAHADHTGLVERTRPTIPVYLSRGTSKMLLRAYKVRPGFTFPALDPASTKAAPLNAKQAAYLASRAKKLLADGEHFLQSLRALCEATDQIMKD